MRKTEPTDGFNKYPIDVFGFTVLGDGKNLWLEEY